MKKNIYTITIEETVSDVFYLEANSLEEAIEKAIAKYNNGVFVLEPGNLIETNLLVGNDNESSDWFELWKKYMILYNKGKKYEGVILWKTLID